MAMQNGYRKVYVRALARGFWRALERVDSLAILGAIVIGALGAWWSDFRTTGRLPWETLSKFLDELIQRPTEHPPWEALAIVLGALVAVRLITTPYRLYATERKARERAQKALAASLVPKFEIRKPVLVENKIGDKPTRSLRIPIYNKSPVLAHCSVAHLLKIQFRGMGDFGDSMVMEHNILQLTWLTNGGTIIEIYPQATEWLNVVTAREYDTVLKLATNTPLPFDPKNMGWGGEYLLVMEIKAENSVPLRFQLSLRWNLSLDTLGLTTSPITLMPS
jgi:hypothetical protein